MGLFHRDFWNKGPLKILLYILRYCLITGALFLVELYAWALLRPEDPLVLLFGALWALILGAVLFVLPRTASRILFGIVYFVLSLWAIAQVGYYQVFHKLMWISTVLFAGEGAEFITESLKYFSLLWWILSPLLLCAGVGILIWYPRTPKGILPRLPLLLPVVSAIVCLSILPEQIFLRDNDIWGTRSEYGQSSSYRAAYETMYDANKLYHICGFYHCTYRDIWKNILYPLTPAHRAAQEQQRDQVDDYFTQRGPHTENELTGIMEGKNVVLVLMESMDDYMITRQDTPTISRLMEEGINFTQFYTPGYGSARTLNSEFCMNTGIYLPTTGKYVFNYVTNDFSQSIASQLSSNGYSGEVFHYNSPSFYSRGVFEPAMGYNSYNTYEAYTQDQDLLYNDNALFEIPELNSLFFREGQTFNTIITRSAHLSYVYREVLSHYALKQYPEYKGLYGSEEEDCARVKARLVDDMFKRLLEELEANGQLENTVIIAMTDHYTYGYKNETELLALSGVSADQKILLERTPCFIWSADCPSMEIDKTLNTADLVPTVLNLMGIDPGCNYLGQDAFDPNYTGYAIFPDGSWISDGVICDNGVIIGNTKEKILTEEYLSQMQQTASVFIQISNLLLTCDYYSQ